MLNISERINIRHLSLDDLDRADGFEPTDQPANLPVVSASALLSGPAPTREWHAPDLIPAGNVTLLSGDGGTGKTLLALQLAASTAAHKPWLGMPVKGGHSLFLTAEDDIDELHRRLEAVSADMRVTGDHLADLDLLSLAGSDAILAAPEGGTNILRPTPLFAALDDKVKATKPCLVVIDTLADTFAGQENDRAQARQFIGLLRGLSCRHGCTILLLSHPSLTGMSTKSGMSGSTAWHNSVRSRLFFQRIEKDGIEDDSDARVLRTMKANYGPTGSEIKVRWQCGAFIEERRAADGISLMAARARADRVFLDLLSAYQAEGRKVSATPSSTYAPAVFGKDARSEGIGARGLTEAMNRLFAARRIRTVEYGPASKPRTRLEIVTQRGRE
jgi:RecA-family ATPase